MGQPYHYQDSVGGMAAHRRCRRDRRHWLRDERGVIHFKRCAGHTLTGWVAILAEAHAISSSMRLTAQRYTSFVSVSASHVCGITPAQKLKLQAAA